MQGDFEPMTASRAIRQFFFPSLTPWFVIRVLVVALLAYLFFGYLCIPLRIKGSSMAPTYRTGGFNFCWTLRFVRSEPKPSDVVAIRFAGRRIMLLKRIVAVQDSTVEFRGGRLFVDGNGVDEPYLRYPSDWSLPPRRVMKGHVYVVGDNRSMPIENHVFGQTPIERIVGGPLW
jgi:signal peptidase I